MLKYILPLKILNLKAFRALGLGLGLTSQSKPMPINFTVSVTNRCNARCKTCNIWRIYEEHPSLNDAELSAEEFARIFTNIGKCAYWFTLSGGEPFLRKDIVEIYDALIHHCAPNIVNIPTNATAPKHIEKRVREFLEIDNKNPLIINLSLDGVRSLHDEIRGVKGNFEKLMDTYERLTALREDYENLRVGVHTVVSIHNIGHLEAVYDFVRGRNPKPDSHIFEIAEERVELDTIGSGITPEHDSFASAFEPLKARVNRDYLKRDLLSRITQSFRLEYYDKVGEILKERRQIIPCYAGFASCQISAYGDVWACCVAAKSLGNLRDVNFEFDKLWHSEKANELRAAIKRGECYCPLANAMYTSMFCNFSMMRKVLGRILR